MVITDNQTYGALLVRLNVFLISKSLSRQENLSENFRSLADVADACKEANDDGASTDGAEEDPGDEVVDAHEFSV